MLELFIQLSVVLGIALAVSLAMKFLRQPLIIGYIITGIIVGPLAAGVIEGGEELQFFSHIGVALLLFIVGLGLQPKMIRDVGKIAVITGLGQMVFTVLAGYFIAGLLGFNYVESLYLAIAYAFSSTIIVLRLLYNKDEYDTLYGRISIGFLLVQDIVALIIFLILSSTASIGTGSFASVIGLILLKVAVISAAIFILIKFIIPHVDKLFAKNKELLFIFSIGICFIFAAVFYKLQFSLELGALAAGVVLSTSPYQREIAMRIQSLRDFFLIIFFITLGANVNLAGLEGSLIPIIVFSLFILIGNPIILLLIMRSLRYTIKTSFFVGLTVAQISEFSLILVGMGIALGHLNQSFLSQATIVGIITITVSTYFVSYNHQLFHFFKKILYKIFKDKNIRRERGRAIEQAEVIMFGCHRIGAGLLKQMEKMGIKFLVVDYDPDVARQLSADGVNNIYGSADDVELLDDLPFKKAKLIISTIPDYEVNLLLISYAKRVNKKLNIICIANHHVDAVKLYDAGASFVIMPPYLGGRFMAELFEKNKWDNNKYQIERKRHLADLKYLRGRLAVR